VRRKTRIALRSIRATLAISKPALHALALEEAPTEKGQIKMIKKVEFDKPRYFGATGTEASSRMPETVQIDNGQDLILRYKGESVAVRVTRVATPQSKFEGEIQTFGSGELEFKDLKHGDMVEFAYEDIEHIQ